MWGGGPAASLPADAQLLLLCWSLSFMACCGPVTHQAQSHVRVAFEKLQVLQKRGGPSR